MVNGQAGREMAVSTKQVGRLALRVEGKWWVAYYAMPDTMNGAIELGRINMNAVRQSDAVMESFKGTMKILIGEILEERLDAPIDHWDEQKAPEHERSGRA